MIDPRICPHCGQRSEQPVLVSADPATLACPACPGRRSFLRQPLFCLTGPSGAGKSTVAAIVGPCLAGRVVTLEQDVLWDPELADRPGGTVRFRATWLRLAAMIGQSGRPVLLCGTVVPAELEPLPERVLFAAVHYLALDHRSELLAARLRARPAWRGWDEHRIAEMVAFADELRATAATMRPPVDLLDATGRDASEVAGQVQRWVLDRLGG